MKVKLELEVDDRLGTIDGDCWQCPLCTFDVEYLVEHCVLGYYFDICPLEIVKEKNNEMV